MFFMFFQWPTDYGIARAVFLANGAANTVTRIGFFDGSFDGSSEHLPWAYFNAQAALNTEFLVEAADKTRHPFKASESIVNLC